MKINDELARNLQAKLVYETEVPIEDFFAEVLELSSSKEDQYLEDFLSCRLQVVRTALSEDKIQ